MFFSRRNECDECEQPSRAKRHQAGNENAGTRHETKGEETVGGGERDRAQNDIDAPHVQRRPNQERDHKHDRAIKDNAYATNEAMRLQCSDGGRKDTCRASFANLTGIIRFDNGGRACEHEIIVQCRER